MRFAAFLLLAAAAAGCSAPFTDRAEYRPVSAGGDAASRDATRLPEGAGPELPAGPLTLRDCIERALLRNRRGWIAERRVLLAEDRYREDVARILPKVTLEGRYDWRNNDRGSVVGGLAVVAGERDYGTARASLLVPLYDFGQSGAARDADERRIDAARHESDRARQEIALAVSQAYFRVLEARRIVEVVEESIRLVERQAAVARDFLGQGLVARSDVLTAEVQLAERGQDLARARNNAALALAVLNRLIGEDQERATELAESGDVAPWAGGYPEALRLAVDRRPDLAALRFRIEAAQDDWRSTSRGHLPSLYASADYIYADDDTLLNKDWLQAAAVVSVPLFDGLGTEFRTARREREIAEAIDLRDEATDEALLQVKQAWLEFEEAQSRLPLARRGIELAEENLRVIRDQYSEGLLSSADVLAEEDRLSRSRTALARAQYDAHAARARLACAVGEPPDARPGSPE